ncbi:MAG: SH3 domain-containing protein [Clostridia bacterium]|nr:SH3 domain-containing protein [Clostridia bacterium]
MKGRLTRTVRSVLFLCVLLAALACAATAFAADPEMETLLPGRWSEEYEGVETVLALGEDGVMSLSCRSTDGSFAWTCGGTWSFTFVPDYSDHLTLHFTLTNNPAYEGTEYDVECLYEAYTESWVENDTEQIALILTAVSCSGVCPFEEAFGSADVVLYRRLGPNMRIANCKEWVALREKPNKSATRLAKVPLGAPVLAYPESRSGDFILCVYHDQYGYILAQYLEPIE